MEAPTLRPVTQADVPFLLDLRRATMNAHLAASGVSLSDADHLARVLAAFDCASVVLLAGVPVGLLKVVRAASQWELVQIQLAPSVQGGGLRSRLVRSVIAEARAAGASVRLSVLKANPARRLYERLGFTVVGESEHSYEMALSA